MQTYYCEKDPACSRCAMILHGKDDMQDYPMELVSKLSEVGHATTKLHI